jgi:hypothetical protein
MTLFRKIGLWCYTRPRWLKLVLGIGLGVLIVGRLALPYVLKDYVNDKLSHLHDYKGTVGDITVHLWRGAYRIHKVNIYKISGKIQEPFFEANYLDMSIEWPQLFHGVVVAKVFMLEPKIHFVSGPTKDQSQMGAGDGWDKLLKSLLPFDLNRLELNNGSIYFLNHYSKPPVNVFLNEMNLVAANLTNVQNQEEKLPATVQTTAKTIGGGSIDAQVKLNLLTQYPAFELTGDVNGMNLIAINSFIQAYGKFEVDKGSLSLYTSVASQDGTYDGYVKIFFKNLHVFVWEKEKRKDILQIFWDAIVGTATTLLTNPNGTLATKVPISGSYGKSQVGTWQAIGSVIENAFIRALLPKLDEKITLKTVEKKLKPAPAPASSHTPEKSFSKPAPTTPKP